MNYFSIFLGIILRTFRASACTWDASPSSVSENSGQDPPSAFSRMDLARLNWKRSLATFQWWPPVLCCRNLLFTGMAGCPKPLISPLTILSFRHVEPCCSFEAARVESYPAQTLEIASHVGLQRDHFNRISVLNHSRPLQHWHHRVKASRYNKSGMFQII